MRYVIYKAVFEMKMRNFEGISHTPKFQRFYVACTTVEWLPPIKGKGEL